MQTLSCYDQHSVVNHPLKQRHNRSTRNPDNRRIPERSPLRYRGTGLNRPLARATRSTHDEPGRGRAGARGYNKTAVGIRRSRGSRSRAKRRTHARRHRRYRRHPRNHTLAVRHGRVGRKAVGVRLFGFAATRRAPTGDVGAGRAGVGPRFAACRPRYYRFPVWYCLGGARGGCGCDGVRGLLRWVDAGGFGASSVGG